MAGAKRPRAVIHGTREAAALASTLGADVASARRRLKLTQQQLGDRVGLSQARISEVERGRGAKLPVGTWIALGLALGTPFAASVSRPRAAATELSDAAHLEIQEFLLVLARRNGRPSRFELATRPADPSRSVDILVQDDRHRCLILQEAWNRFGDLGAGARSSNRKLAEMEAAAVVASPPGGSPYRASLVWVIRDRAANAPCSGATSRSSRRASRDRRPDGCRPSWQGSSPRPSRASSGSNPAGAG